MFRLSIVTPEKVFYDDDIVSLVVPGTEGYLGVLSNHAPLITALQIGRIEFRNTDEEVSVLSVTNGFLEVSGNVASLLCDAAEYAKDIDVARAESALKKAESKIADYNNGQKDIDIEEEKLAVVRAKNRMKIHKENS